MGSQTKSNRRDRLASPKRLRVGGYTLIEMLVVFAILAMTVTLSESALRAYVYQIGGQDTSTAYVQMLRRAQSLATSGRSDSAWGVRIATSTIVLFKGTSYASRDTTYDEVYQSGVSYTLSGVSEVNFAKLTGSPNLSGTTTITVSSTTQVSVHINAKGTITY